MTIQNVEINRNKYANDDLAPMPIYTLFEIRSGFGGEQAPPILLPIKPTTCLTAALPASKYGTEKYFTTYRSAHHLFQSIQCN